MPLYSCKCTKCSNEQDYVAKIDDRDKTPLCKECNSPTTKMLSAPMIAAMGLTSGSFSCISPIDGTQIQGRTEYFAHMKKHNVVPESDLKGQSEHVAKQRAKEESTARKETIARIVNK